MMKCFNFLLVAALLLGIIGMSFLYTAFFTSHWLNAIRLNSSVTESHGLWDNGIEDLNCAITPFDICMYTRAGIFTSMIITLPSIFCLASSAIVRLSGGALHVSGGFARSSAIMFTISVTLAFIGVLLFTLQHTLCITACPPKYSYYSDTWNTVTFQYSFYLAWVSILLQIIVLVLCYVYAASVASKNKGTYYIQEDKDTTPFPQPTKNKDNRV